MAPHINVTLGGRTYEVPRLNLGEIDQVENLLTKNEHMTTFQISCALLQIVLKRATPAVGGDAVRLIEASPAEINAVITTVLSESGLNAAAVANDGKRARSPIES